MRNFYWALLLLYFFSQNSCISDKNGFNVRPSRQSRKFIKLNINGCYIASYEHPILKQEEMGCFIFYSNGITLFYGPINKIEDSVKSQEWLKKQIQKRINFQDSFFRRKECGGYSISEDKILIQIFRYVPNGGNSLCTYKGKIISDKSIYIEECIFPDKPVYCRKNFYLEFVEMPKPDSSNQLMNKSWYWGD